MNKCTQLVIDLPACIEQLKTINLNILLSKENIKVRPIIDEDGAYTFHVPQVTSKTLYKNEYTNNNSQNFSKQFSTLSPYEHDEKSCCVRA